MNTTRRILAAVVIAAAIAGIALAGFGQVEDGSSGQSPVSASSHPVEFRLPARGAVVSGTTEITLKTDSSVARADIFIDGVLWKSSAPNPFDWNSARIWYSWDSTSVSNSKHAISVSAFDSTGAEIGRDSLDITVQNETAGGASDTVTSAAAEPAPVNHPQGPGNRASDATGNNNVGGIVQNSIKAARSSIAAGLAVLGSAVYAPLPPTPNLTYASIPAGIRLVNQSSAVGSGSNCTLATPAGTASDDTMILMAFGGTTVTANGFSAVPSGRSGMTLTGNVMSLLYRIANGSEGATITAKTSSGGISCILQTWSGVNAAAPFDAVSPNPEFGVATSKTASVSGITTQSDGDELLIFAGSAHNSDTGSWNTPAGFGNPLSQAVPGGSIAGFSKPQGLHGATGTISSGWTSSNNARWAMGLLALQPAAVDPPPTPTPIPTPTLTPSPVPSGMPSPPTLSNAQIFQNGAVFGGHIVNGTGATSNDNYAALQAALNAGDVDIRAGTYVINAPNSYSGITPISGRKIYCENLYSSLPASPSSPVVLKIPFYYSGSDANVFTNWSNGELYGCEIEGYHYPNTTWSGDNGHSLGLVNDSVINNSPSPPPGNFVAYGNGFDGWMGWAGVFDIFTDHASWVANHVPDTFDISYNRFSNCNWRTVEIDMATNVKFTHNTVVDCEETTEIAYPTNQDGAGHPTQTVLIDHNDFSWVHGIKGGSYSGWDNFVSAGAVCHGTASTPWSGACAPGQSVDNSQSTFSNNTIHGPQTSWMLESEDCLNGGVGLIKGVYRGNSCTGGCSIECGPGNPNANVWEPGSNQ